MPGNGSLTALIETSTQVKPTFIGKPEPIITEQALKVLGTKKVKQLWLVIIMIRIYWQYFRWLRYITCPYRCNNP